MARATKTLTLLLAHLFPCVGSTYALAADAGNAIIAGQDALQKTAAPWYDAEADDVRIVTKRRSTAAGERQDWREKTKRPEWSIDWDWDWGWDWNWGNGGGGGGSWFGWLASLSVAQVFQLLGFLVLGLLAAVLLFYGFRSIPYFKKKQPATQAPLVEERTDEERIENLPIQPVKKKGDFLSLAESCYQSGNYGDAIVYLFSHRLLQLDRAGYIRLTRGKTNRQYLYEVTESQTLYSILGKTIVCFEDVFFGKHDLPKARFEESWRANSEFDAMIQQALS